jgi:hypothetical protein
MAWTVHHFLPNNETTSVEHWHVSDEVADSEGKARTRFEFKFLADVCRTIFSSCFLILNDVNMFIASGSGNRDIMFMSDKEPQPKYRLGGLRSRATAATGNGRAAGVDGDLSLLTTDSSGNLQDIFIAHRGTNKALSMRGAIMELQRTTALASASALTFGPENGNTTFISGTTGISTINRTGWQAGAIINLHFQGIVTVTHSTAASTSTVASIQLVGATNYTSAAGTALTLQLLWTPGGDNTTNWYWRELSRTAA